MITTFEGKTPQISRDAFVAPDAVVLGDVVLGADSSIWYGCVVRGDVHYIRIGEKTNIQDRTVIHVTSGKFATHVGSRVTVGHGAILHGCRIADDVLIGMGATVLDDSEIPSGCIVAAGAVVPPGKTYAPNSLIVGSPARVRREVSDAELRWIADSAEHYVALAQKHARL
ncbi:MAG: gamma carbonic anhydrase family protein [Deltaproteobacteria bacterium]|nr:gamma carbonic anhydrase family protein [Deltaproteobacteria bacterium]